MNITSSYKRQIFFVLTRSIVLLCAVYLLIEGNGAYAEKYSEEYIHDTVTEPLVDLISLTIPKEVSHSIFAKYGLVDITDTPFQADPTGKKDSTSAIQQAVNFARDHQMVCYFPPGTYKVSDTISCIQNRYLRSSGSRSTGNYFPCVLQGNKVNRPKLVLAPNSQGFTDPKNPKYVVHYWARDKEEPNVPTPSISFNQIFTDIDIEIGEGNAGAIGIRHRAAQGSSVQNSVIDATHGYCGVEGGIGSGGSHINLTIIGGEIGMNLYETQPNPTIVGITFKNQRGNAFFYQGRQSLTAVGIHIIKSNTETAIITDTVGWQPFHGIICLVDSVIEYNSTADIAIATKTGIYLKNVYCKNAEVVVSANSYSLSGKANGWKHIKEFALGVDSIDWKNYKFKMPIYTSAKRSIAPLVNVKDEGPSDVVSLTGQHIPKMISFEYVSNVVNDIANAKDAPFNARGDGKYDDTIALQKAIDASDIVFLPKGIYVVSRPLRLKKTSKLVGVGQHLSLICAIDKKKFSRGQQPLVATSDAADSDTHLEDIGMYMPNEIPGGYILRWQAGGNSQLKNVLFLNQPPLNGWKSSDSTLVGKDFPLVVATNNAGGRWYNFYQLDATSKLPGYRHLLISKTKGPFRIYQCNPEHSRGEYNLEISESENVTLYGIKGEIVDIGTRRLVKITDSKNIAIYGYGGNAQAAENDALFHIKDSDNVVLAGVVDNVKDTPELLTNSMIKEESNNNATLINTFDRPILFKN